MHRSDVDNPAGTKVNLSGAHLYLPHHGQNILPTQPIDGRTGGFQNVYQPGYPSVTQIQNGFQNMGLMANNMPNQPIGINLMAGPPPAEAFQMSIPRPDIGSVKFT
jgi:hypothetical protein